MSHYDSEYFNWQKNIGAFGGMANQFKFKDYVRPTDRVVDFGCGGGYLLANLNCSEKIGVEINETARAEAAGNRINVVATAHEVPDNWADVIISNNALEHTLSPYHELTVLHSKLRPGGRIVFVVPHELKSQWREKDVHQHLYTWSPLNIGNLFQAAGYTVTSVDVIRHLWPPHYIMWRRILGQKGFDIACWIYGIIWGEWRQVRVRALKPQVRGKD